MIFLLSCVFSGIRGEIPPTESKKWGASSGKGVVGTGVADHLGEEKILVSKVASWQQ